MKTTLTIEQSQRLIELGVDTNKASKAVSTTINEEEYNDPKHYIFTLTDLLSILPKEIKHGTTTYHLNIDYPPIEQVAARYITEDDDLDSLCGMMCDELIDALYELTIWLIENEFINN